MRGTRLQSPPLKTSQVLISLLKFHRWTRVHIDYRSMCDTAYTPRGHKEVFKAEEINEKQNLHTSRRCCCRISLLRSRTAGLGTSRSTGWNSCVVSSLFFLNNNSQEAVFSPQVITSLTHRGLVVAKLIHKL